MASMFFMLFSFLFADSRIVVGLFTLIWALIGVYCAKFIHVHGIIYVHWPRLNPMVSAVEGYNKALSRVKKDKIVGHLVAGHERGASSNIRLIHLEEGKKRIE